MKQPLEELEEQATNLESGIITGIIALMPPDPWKLTAKQLRSIMLGAVIACRVASEEQEL